MDKNIFDRAREMAAAASLIEEWHQDSENCSGESWEDFRQRLLDKVNRLMNGSFKLSPKGDDVVAQCKFLAGLWLSAIKSPILNP